MSLFPTSNVCIQIRMDLSNSNLSNSTIFQLHLYRFIKEIFVRPAPRDGPEIPDYFIFLEIPYSKPDSNSFQSPSRSAFTKPASLPDPRFDPDHMGRSRQVHRPRTAQSETRIPVPRNRIREKDSSGGERTRSGRSGSNSKPRRSKSQPRQRIPDSVTRIYPAVQPRP